MENQINENDEVKKIKNNLNDLIQKGGQIKRENILEAEEISFNNILPSNIIYDEYGFINKDNSTKK